MSVSKPPHVCGDVSWSRLEAVAAAEPIAFLGIRDIAEDTAETGTFAEAVDHLKVSENRWTTTTTGVARILADRNLSARGDGAVTEPQRSQTSERAFFHPRNSVEATVGRSRSWARRPEERLDREQKIRETSQRGEQTWIGLADMSEMSELVDVGADAGELAIGCLINRGHRSGEGAGERGLAQVGTERNLVLRGAKLRLLVFLRRKPDRDANGTQAKRVLGRTATLGHQELSSFIEEKG
jgi:hypothetical protein